MRRIPLLSKFEFFFLFLFAAIPAFGNDLDLRSIPIAEWLDRGEAEQLSWDVTVRPASLGMDQRLEVLYTVRVKAKDLNRTGDEHELFLISRVSTPEAEWLTAPNIIQQDIDQTLPNNVQVAFNMRIAVQPGEYVLWIVLYDRKTDIHNVTKRRLRVSDIGGDPLPLVYSRMPLIEFPQLLDEEGALTYVKSELWLPIENRRPIDLELISMFSPPEQWTGRSRALRAHNSNTIGSLAALSQMELREGTISVTGLDLSRREVVFEQRAFRHVNWPSLLDALKKAQSHDITASALVGSKENGAFFRDYLDRRLSAEPVEDRPMRVIVVVTSSWLFERGSDLTPIQLEGDCNCRIYHLRYRLNANDIFDQLEKFMRPLRPRTFNLASARDLRRAIAEILEDLRAH